MVYAYSVFATTISPDVPTSSRCTMPLRSAAPLVEMVNPAPARWPITVGPVQPGDGCAATPTGLSTTMISSSSYTIRRLSMVSGTTLTSDGGGSSTSSRTPAATRDDFGAGTPSTWTRPDSISSAALV